MKHSKVSVEAEPPTFIPTQEITLQNHIHVSVRIKPLSELETQQQKIRGGPQWQIVNQKTITDRMAHEFFHFDRVFNSDVTTQQIFQTDVQPMIINAINGYNVTILAYGQTCSGKTFTISGNQESPGLISLTANELFKGLNYLLSPQGIINLPISKEKIKNDANIERSVNVEVSFLEIYNENVNDLLDYTKRNLEVRETKSGEILVDSLTRRQVINQQEFLECAQKGEQLRVFAETKVNKNSSRSHTIFRVFLQITDKNTHTGTSVIRASQINLVDLAGSEGASKTKSQGVRLREGGSINKSLLALSNVIYKLSKRNNISNKNNLYINFRDSKLTRILQNALLGQSQTAIICCISQLTQNTQETLQALYFGSKAKQIRTEVHLNEIIKDSPDKIAQKIAQMHRTIEQQKNQIMLKDSLLKQADDQAKQFQIIGPLKTHIERLELQLKEKVEELVYVKIEKEELRQNLLQKNKEIQSIENELERVQQVSGSLQHMYESVNTQNVLQQEIIQPLQQELSGLKDLIRLNKLTNSTSVNQNEKERVDMSGESLIFESITNQELQLKLQDLTERVETLNNQLKNANQQITEYEKNQKSMRARIQTLIWESQSKDTQIMKLKVQCGGLQQQVIMQKQATDELFKELDQSLHFVKNDEGDLTHQLVRLSFGTNNQRCNVSRADHSVLINVLEEQVKYLQQERDEILESKQQALQEIQIEQQQQLDQVAKNYVEHEKCVEHVYGENDELWEELERIEMEKDDAEIENNELKKELKKARQEIEQLKKNIKQVEEQPKVSFKRTLKELQDENRRSSCVFQSKSQPQQNAEIRTPAFKNPFSDTFN